MEIIKNPQFDFLGKAKYFVALSALLIGAGIFWIATGHLHYGVEFSGGTQLIAQFKDTPDVDKIRNAVEKVSPGAVIQTYGDAKTNKVLVRISQEAAEGDLDAPARAVRQALADSYAQNPVLESSSEIVGPVVGAELRQKAILLTVLGLLFQLIYIAWRFKGGIWGAGATIAAFHDVLVCLAFLAFLLEFIPVLGPIVAAVPAILVGLSVSPMLGLWVTLLYIGIQQVESYLLLPLVQRWALHLPPALSLIGIVVFGVLFGWVGVLLAAPLMVATTVWVRKLYLESILEPAKKK